MNDVPTLSLTHKKEEEMNVMIQNLTYTASRCSVHFFIRGNETVHNITNRQVPCSVHKEHKWNRQKHLRPFSAFVNYTFGALVVIVSTISSN